MKLLITGASGYVGARLYFDLRKDFSIFGTYHNDQLSRKFIHLDITDQKEVEPVISSQKPDVIIHVASNANARWCEANPDAAINLNEKATQYIVDVANKIGTRVIYISSYAALNTSNIYGRTKYNSEEIIKQVKKGWVVLRPSFILGFSPNTVNDRSFNRMLKNLDERAPAVYDTSWKFNTTYVGHISEIIKEIIIREIDNKTIPVAVEELKSRYDTAKDILEPFGVSVRPVDKHDSLAVIHQDLGVLQELGLPFYSYQEVIQKIISDIKNRNIYKLD